MLTLKHSVKYENLNIKTTRLLKIEQQHKTTSARISRTIGGEVKVSKVKLFTFE